jgi:hypothetical protein
MQPEKIHNNFHYSVYLAEPHATGCGCLIHSAGGGGMPNQAELDECNID